MDNRRLSCIWETQEVSCAVICQTAASYNRLLQIFWDLGVPLLPCFSYTSTGPNTDNSDCFWEACSPLRTILVRE